MLLKYDLLGHLPGALGARYRRKAQRLRAVEEFDDALGHSSSLLCIDLGANVGEVTQKMARSVRQVIAFEPDPWALEKLRANLAGYGNVKIEAAAAGVSDDPAILYRHLEFVSDPASLSQSSSTLANKGNIDRTAGIEVRQLDFLRYLANLDTEIGILKMDIEGAEVEILEALLARPDLLGRISYVFAETHERIIPEHRSRVAVLRERVQQIERPRINLDWH